MRKNWRNKLHLHLVKGWQWPIACLMIILASLSCSSHKEAEHADSYICPMHPTVISDRPSTCPVCGMDLVRKARPGEEVAITEELARLIKSPNEVVVATIKTVKGEFKSMASSTQAQGIVTYDTRLIYNIPARIAGRLDKVYLKYTFQPVRKGQPVAEIYSTELLTAQRELLYLAESDPGNKELLEGARQKLYLLGATEKQVADILATKQPVYTFTIFSAYDGYVISETQTPPTMAIPGAAAASNGGGMSDGQMGATGTSLLTTSKPQTTGELIREGSYVATGQTLFKVVSAAALRVELNLPSSQTGSVKTGDNLALDFGDGTQENGKVDFIQPFFSNGETFTKIRLLVANRSGLRIGQLVFASIQLKATEAIWLPKEAVLDMGLDKIVFVKERGLFKPKKVTIGMQAEGAIEIKQGIASSDEVASNAQYLIDSESFIKSK